MLKRFYRMAFPWFMGAAIAIQMFSIFKAYVRPWALRIWDLRYYPAWERAAKLLEIYDKDFGGYIGFVRENVPEDAKVILPPREFGSAFEHIGLMQYFLFPRRIDNCGRNEVEACIKRVTGPKTYILGLSFFPPRDLAEEYKAFIQYDGNMGIYAPINAGGDE